MKNFLDNSQEIISVSEVNKRAKNILEKELKQIWIEGEISSFTAYASGHWYFTIKDKKSSLSCVMLSYENNKILFKPQVGDNLILNGNISIYQPTGKYQLNVKHIELAGEGALLRAFEDLKKKLDLEGMFDPSTKKEMPSSPYHIAAITSPDGAVLQDIINVLGRRSPLIKLTLVPTLVQGEKASNQICKAFDLVSNLLDVDIIIIARGGGSIEDLWAFNTESVARAIHKSKIPTISAVGHETDFTISDFVADHRAPTPSAAAEIVSQFHSSYPERINHKQNELINLISSKISTYSILIRNIIKMIRHPGDRLREISQKIDFLDSTIKKELSSRLALKEQESNNLNKLFLNASPLEYIVNKDVLISSNYNLIKGSIEKIINSLKANLKNNSSTLDAVSPLAIISRGFSILTDSNGRIMRSVEDVKLGDIIEAKLKDGSLNTKIIKKRSIEKN